MAIALGNLFGRKVIVTCGSDEKCARALELGAAAAINYRDAGFRRGGEADHRRRGVAVVLDMVGGDYVPRNLACLADDGRHVSIAFQRGASAEVPSPEVMRRRLTLTGSTLRPRSRRVQDAGRRRDRARPSGPMSKAAAEAGDRQRLPARPGSRSASLEWKPASMSARSCWRLRDDVRSLSSTNIRCREIVTRSG